MENLHELLIRRRSIRRYTDQTIDPEQVRLILEAGLMSPSSKSSRPWRFVVVEDKEMLERLSLCREMGSAPIGRAKLAVVVCVDSTVTDPWVEDGSIAAAFMQLQAADLGLGSCWIQIRGRFTPGGATAEEYVQEALGIPETVSVLCVVTLGHPDEQRKSIDTSKLEWEKVHIGKW